MNLKLFFGLAAATLGLAGCGPEKLENSPKHKSLDAEYHPRVTELLREMTLEEKIGQLTLYTSDMDTTGPSISTQYKEDIRAGRVGAVFNAFTSEFTRELQQLTEQSRLKIPLLFGYDVIHGFKTIFPIPLGESASWDLPLLEQSAHVAATEAAAAGLHWTFAPMVDVARDPRWGRVAEGAGEDTYLGEKIAAARVRGFQGEIGDDDGVLACAKHFAAYGGAEAGRDYNTVDVSERTLREVYLPPFKAAVDAGVATFMTAFNEIAGVPSSANRWLMKDLLRDEWGFDGFVVSDYTSINELIPHGIAEDKAKAGELAFNAGLDMDMQGSVYHDHLAELVSKGKVSEEDIDRAVGRILTWKQKLGLFDDPYKFSNPERERQRVLSAEHMAIARDVARKSIVLLKNANATLPLRKDVGTIAVIGPLGNNKNDVIGSWSAAGKPADAVSLLEGIREKVAAGTEVLWAHGVDIESDRTDMIPEALQVAAQADVIIAALGESKDMSGEAASRSSLDLPGHQLALLQKLHALGKPVVLVLMNGRPLVLNWPEAHVPAILETWFLGTQTGHAIADVLFGDYNPSGRLPVSFPRSLGQVPLYYNAKNTGRPFVADQKYTSKYLDVPNTPLYPFGFGLSYTTFSYGDVRLSKSEITRGEKLQVEVDITNTGAREGTETVQLYLTDEVASVTRPVKELRGFQKVALRPGEKKTVRFELGMADLEFLDLDLKKTVEPGTFKVQVGENSANGKVAKFTLK